MGRQENISLINVAYTNIVVTQKLHSERAKGYFYSWPVKN